MKVTIIVASKRMPNVGGTVDLPDSIAQNYIKSGHVEAVTKNKDKKSPKPQRSQADKDNKKVKNVTNKRKDTSSE